MQKPLQAHLTTGWSDLCRQLKHVSKTALVAGSLVCAGWLGTGEAKAQAAGDYVFTASGGTYTPLGASATQVATLHVDGALSSPINIGFTFNFAGTDYTQLRASSDGYVSFGTSTSTNFTNNLATSAVAMRPLLAPLWDDLDGRATGGSNASYEVTGAPGSQVFTFEWQNWEWNYNSGNPVISFQVKLYEGTNKIEFIYQQESGAVTSGTASIGIAGPATGAGNYLSLNNTSASPTASSTSETTSISTKPATGQIYTFSKPDTDISAIALVSPVATGCYGASETVSVTVRNTGGTTIDFAANPLTVNMAVTGTNPTTFPAATVNSGTLAPGATQTVVVATGFNMTAPGTYTFNGTATVTGDGSAANNTLPTATRTVAAVATLPQSVDFTGFTGANLTTLFPNWKEATGATTPTGTSSAWTSSAASQTTFFGSTTAKLNYPTAAGTVRQEWIVGPAITPTASTAITFKAAVTSSAGEAAATMLPTDSVNVMVSTDCGATFTRIGSVSGSNNLTNALTNFNFSLGSYAGQNIIVALKGTNGTPRPAAAYDFHVDDIFLGTPPAIDMAANVMVAPGTTGCYTATETVTVTIQNNGLAPIDFAVNPVTVTVNVTGAVTQTLTTTLNTGTLAVGATQNVNVGTLNMNTAGTYTFNGFTSVTGDGNPANDAFAATTRTVTALATLPQTVDFTGFTDANLSTISPGWKEASGFPTPTGTTADWIKDDYGNVTTHPNGASARINLWLASKRAWIIGPKVLASSTTKLKFDMALTTYSGTATAPMGSDDVFQVMISTDCGFTYTPIRTYNASTPISNTGQSEMVDLSTYAGQQIIVAFFASEGTVDDPEDNKLFLDNIFLGTPPVLDLGATALVSPIAKSCFGTETVTVTIKNFGPDTLNFAVNPAIVTLNVTGAVTQTLTVTLSTGTLAPNATQNVNLGNLNMSTIGAYTFNGGVAVTGDGNPNNDNITAVTLQNGMISVFPHIQDFESATTGTPGTFPAGWQMTNPTGFRWEVDAGGTPSTATGPAVDHTTGTAAGKYVFTEASSGSTGAVTYLTTPCINLATLTNPGMDFWYHMAGAGMGTLDVEISGDNGATWTTLTTLSGPQQPDVNSPWLKKTVGFAGFTGNVIVRFKGTLGPLTGSSGFSYEGDMAVDDVKIYDLPSIDLELTALTLPATGCGLTATENVCIIIKNNGIAAATNIPVSYTVNGGTAVTETAGITIAPGATAQYCFTAKANFSAANTYTVVASAALTGDTTTANNSLTGIVTSVPTISAFPYLQDFESGNGGWTASGTSSTWALGTPTGSVINSAASGTNSWVTNLSGNYNNNENSMVTSPCFNLSTLTNPAISMKIWWDAEEDYDGAVLQSSIDGGATWQVVGAYNDPDNWYNNDDISADPGNQPVGWSGDGSTGSGAWVLAKHALTGLGGQASVKFRIAFASDGSVVDNGFAFDDVTIYEVPAIPTITASGPTTFCTGGSVVLTAASTTPGVTYQWFNNGTAIAGATAATYTATASGSYTVEALAGTTPSAASAATVVTVNTIPATPTITAAGGSTTICQGSSVALTGVSATPGATFQWFNNGTAVPGATSASFTANAAGSYTVVASANGCSSAASAATAVTVTPKPTTPVITKTGNQLSVPAVTGATYQWYSVAGSILTAVPGATAVTFTPATNGDYTVKVTVNGCESDEATAMTVVLGISSLAPGMEVSVYPNPTAGKFTVNLVGFEKEATVQIISVTGQVIAAEKVTITSDKASKGFDLGGMAKGIYILKVTSGNNLTFRKVMLD